jgi:peptidoglycan/LPS O-acetylase OafA/YrhL
MIKGFFKIKIESNRIYGLDILRAIAILFVLLEHSMFFINKSYKNTYRAFVFDGVSIFFVLSGFLIGGILIRILETKQPTFKNLLNFWIRRWFRTLPPYFLVLIISILLSRQFHWSYLQYFTFTQNLVQKQHGFFGESWSLSVEEWFYLLIPSAFFTLCFFKLKPRNSIIFIAVVFLFVVTSYRLFKYLKYTVNDFYIFDAYFRKIVATRLDSIMYGLIGAFFSYYHRDFWLKNRRWKLVIGLAILVMQQYFYNTGYRAFNIYDVVFSFSISSIACLLLLPYLSQLKSGKGIFYKFFTAISLISYSAYLLNLNIVIFNIINPFLDFIKLKNTWGGNALGYVCFWLITLLLSVVSYKYVELPTTALRDRFRNAGKQNKL